MKLEEAIERLDRSAGLQHSQQAVRIRQRFSNILQEVKYKELSPGQKEVMETELDNIFADFDLESAGVDRILRLRLNNFIKFLRIHFALMPEGYCARLGMRFGFAGGSLVMLFSIFLTEGPYRYYWPLAGLLLGVMIGSAYDRYCKSKGRTFLTKMI